MPGSICISAIQPPTTTPCILQVAVGQREYSGNIDQDDLSFPVTSLRENMVIMMYNADMELISKAELKTKAIVESGTMDVTLNLDTGENIILKLQFLLNEDDRKRIQEMRSSAMKRKQQELLEAGYELNFPGSPFPEPLIEKISNIEREGDQPKLRKSMSLDNLQEKPIYTGENVDPRMNDSRDLLLKTGGTNTSKFEGPNDSTKRQVKPQSKSSSSVKKMISAFESTSPQGWAPETAVTLTDSACIGTGKAIIPFGDRGSNYRSGKHVLFHQKKSNAPGQTGVPNAYESRGHRSSSRDGASKQNISREEGSSWGKRRSQAKHRRSIGPYSLEQTHPRDYLQHPLNYSVATSTSWMHPHVCVTTASRQLKYLLELERLNSLAYMESGSKSLRMDEDITESADEDDSTASTQSSVFPFPMLNGWLINQGVRGAIVIIACGAMFLNNR